MKFIPQSSALKNVRQAKTGIDYVDEKILKRSPRRVTKARFWRIPHDSGAIEISLKIGRYTYDTYGNDEIEIKDPKSELTLDDEELKALTAYLAEHYEPLKDGVKQYIVVDGKLDASAAEQLRTFFNKPNKEELVSVILENDILPKDLMQSLYLRERLKAIQEFEEMLQRDSSENTWQDWFTKNSWVLGSDIVRILDERRIDVEKISDFLVQAYDGFLDIIEIKKPETKDKFWATTKYRDNHIPSTELVGTIMQATNYIYEVEREANSIKFFERVGHVRVVKPRGVLIYGRSNTWDAEQQEAFRLLNSSYHNLTLMTYDHVLERAKRILGIYQPQAAIQNTYELDDEIPF